MSHSFVLNSVLACLALQWKSVHLFPKKHSGGSPSRRMKTFSVLLEQSKHKNLWSLPDNLSNPTVGSHSAWDESDLWWQKKKKKPCLHWCDWWSPFQKAEGCFILLHTKLWIWDGILGTLLFQSSKTLEDVVDLWKGGLEKERLRF